MTLRYFDPPPPCVFAWPRPARVGGGGDAMNAQNSIRLHGVAMVVLSFAFATVRGVPHSLSQYALHTLSHL